MLRRLTLCAAAFATILSLSAQQKLDLRLLPLADGVMPVAPAFSSSDLSIAPVTCAAEDGTVMVSTFVRLTDDMDTEALRYAGAEITDMIGNIAICNIPSDCLYAVADLDCVVSISPDRRVRLLNDKARSAVKVSDVHGGIGLPQAYDGTGVVVGIMDDGLDPNHVAFRTDDLSKSRVERLWKYSVSATGRLNTTTYDTDAAISKFTTDDKSETHGTHVLGTAAGAYTQGSYQGMAPNAALAIGCGDATTSAIVELIKKVRDYAKETGRPAVVNLSLGDNVGHHDGTEPENVLLNDVAADIPVIIAAGNEADLPIVIKKDLTSDDLTVKTFLMPNDYLKYQANTYQAYGTVEIIGPDSTPFTVKIGLVSRTTNQVVYTLEAGKGKYSYMANSSASGISGTKNTVSQFTSCYTSSSYFGAAAAISPDNNRYYAFVDFDMCNKSTSPAYYPCIIVEGKAGQFIEMYADGYYTDFSTRNLSGWDESTADGTINNMACGKNTIAVGAFSTRNKSPYTGETLNACTSFSSYGTLADGRTLPHFCAPGHTLISAMSGPYVSGTSYDSYYSPKTATVDYNGKKHYYTVMSGTSMATPVVTGITALWLQADPTLTPADIQRIGQKTATVDSYVEKGIPAQWGAGKINALEGLKEILAQSSVESIIDRGNSPFIIAAAGERAFEVSAASSMPFEASVIDLSGRTVLSASANGSTVLDASALTPGVYVIAVKAAADVLTQKVVIK